MCCFIKIHGIRPLIIYEDDKKRYYECLRLYDECENITPLKEFLEYCQMKTWDKKKKNILRLDSNLV